MDRLAPFIDSTMTVFDTGSDIIPEAIPRPFPLINGLFVEGVQVIPSGEVAIDTVAPELPPTATHRFAE
jgi:hypothetical protein